MATNNKATTPAAAPKATNAYRAATAIGKHGLGAVARVTAAAGVAAASAKRYAGSNPNVAAAVSQLTPSFANATFTLTALGKQCLGVAGCIGRNGQPTAMGLTCVGLGNAANGGTSATGAAIAAAILGNPQLVQAMLGTKANGTHLLPQAAVAAKWVQGYVNGLCRPAHGLATKA